jgi:hypothetical protein
MPKTSRLLAGAFAVCALALPTAANATTTTTSATAKTATGSVLAVGPDSVTIQTAGRLTGVIGALTAAATAITAKNYPYVWGGGHAEAGVASIGIKGPGYNGKRVGYDCSGSVTAVLAGAGLWTPGTSVPADNGVIAQLLAQHVIARGVGTAPDEVTLYDDPGVHIFMSVDGRFFGTSDGGGGGDKAGGPGWLDDGAYDATDRAFKKYHVLPSVLHGSTTYGVDYNFQLPATLSQIGLQVGDDITVGYSEAPSGALDAATVTFQGSATTTGLVTAIGTGTVTVQTAAGASVTFAVSALSPLLDGLQLGDTVSVTASPVAGVLTAHTLQITATPAPATTPTPGTFGDGGAAL